MNLRYSARSFLRSPGVTIVLLLSIAAGVGSNAAVYGFAHGLTAPRLRVPLPAGVVSIFARESPGGELSYDDIAAIERSGAFAWIGAVRQTQGTLLTDGRSVIVSIAAVTVPIAQLFDFPLQDGAVVGYRLWQLELEGSNEIRGDAIRVDGADMRVSGIAPEPLEGVYVGRNVDVWMTLRDDSLRESERGSRSFWALGRLQPGVSPREAEARIRAAGQSAGEIAVVPYTGAMPQVADGLSRVGTLLRLAAAAVLLIACANVAAFLLGRAAARAHEISLRVALGASRRALISQLLVDSALVAIAGGAAGALLGMWTSEIVPAFFFERDARELKFSPDVRGTLFAAAACVTLLVGCGLAPLLETRHDRPASVLQREGAGPSPSGRRLRSILVIAQVGASCVLAISAVLLVQGLSQALQTAVRHRMDAPIVATVFARPGYEIQYFRNVEEAALSAPGIAGAAWTARLPGAPPAWQPMRIERGNAMVRAALMDVSVLSPETIDQIVFPPVAGRMFGGRETPYSCRVAVVNEAAAAAIFDGEAVGRVVRDEAGERVEIVGVVATRRKEPKQGPTLYYPAAQVGERFDWKGPMRFAVPAADRTARAVLDATVVSSGYFDAMGFSVVSGRMSAADGDRSTCRVAVVNEEAAERYFQGVATGSAVIDGAGRRTEIIGVVRAAPLGAFGQAPHPAIYFPMSQDVPTAMSVILAARDAPRALVDNVRARVEGVPGRGLFDPVVQTLDEHMSRTSLAPLRIATVLMTASAAIAGALGILGLYGALSAAARQRRREVALRVALGAQARHVAGQVFGQGARLAGAGAAIGALGAFAAARLLRRITPIDPGASAWLWLAAPLVLAAAVLLAGALPARRALKVDPLSIMRDA